MHRNCMQKTRHICHISRLAMFICMWVWCFSSHLNTYIHDLFLVLCCYFAFHFLFFEIFALILWRCHWMLGARSYYSLFSLVLILSDNYFKITGYKMKCNKWTKIEQNSVEKWKWLNFWHHMLVKYASEQWQAQAALVRFFLLFSQFSIFNIHKTRNKML